MEVEHKTLKVALTGSIGSSKTLITKVFEHLAIPVYRSDEKAKMFYENTEVKKEIEKYFGNNYIKNNSVDKSLLAKTVFSDRQKLRLLESIIHPLVKQDYLSWHSFCKTEYTIMESAVVFESKWENMFDRIITVVTPMDLIFERVAIRDKSSTEDIKKRLNNQLSQEEKASKSDYIITNDNKRLIIPQIIQINESLKKIYC